MKTIVIAVVLLAAACGGSQAQSTAKLEGEFLVTVASFAQFDAQSPAPACDTGARILKRTGTMLLNANGTGTITSCRRCVISATETGPLACDLTGAVSFAATGTDVDLTITPNAGPVVHVQARHAGDWLATEGDSAEPFASFRCTNDDCSALLRQVQ